MSIGIGDMERAVDELENLPPSMLDLLERQTTAFLYALWKARGKKKKIITLDSASLTNGNGKR